MSNNCRICGKPLTDYTSVKLGIGPICRASNDITQGDLFMNFHASFTILEIEEDYIYIKDDGGDSRSITNDAEWVISELADSFDISKRRIFYMDSFGIIDELVHENGIFKEFKAGHKGITLKSEKSDFEMIDWQNPVKEIRASFKINR